MIINNYKLSELFLGQTDSLTLNVFSRDVDLFAALSGDYSSVHLDKDFAVKKGYKDKIVHGMLIASYISQFIGMKLPGKQGILQCMDISFRKPLIAPCEITITGEIIKISNSVGQVILKISVSDNSEDIFAQATVKSIVEQMVKVK